MHRPPRVGDPAGERFAALHIFGRTCKENGITHKLTKPYHPWTNGGASLRLRPAELAGEAGVGQVERMNRTINDAKLKVFH